MLEGNGDVEDLAGGAPMNFSRAIDLSLPEGVEEEDMLPGGRQTDREDQGTSSLGWGPATGYPQRPVASCAPGRAPEESWTGNPRP